MGVVTILFVNGGENVLYRLGTSLRPLFQYELVNLRCPILSSSDLLKPEPFGPPNDKTNGSTSTELRAVRDVYILASIVLLFLVACSGNFLPFPISLSASYVLSLCYVVFVHF